MGGDPKISKGKYVKRDLDRQMKEKGLLRLAGRQTDEIRPTKGDDGSNEGTPNT